MVKAFKALCVVSGAILSVGGAGFASYGTHAVMTTAQNYTSGDVSRAKSKVAKAERRVARLEGMDEEPRSNGVEATRKDIADARALLSKIKDAPEYASLNNQLTDIEQRLNAVEERFSSAGAALADAEERLEGYKESGELEADVRTLEGLFEVLGPPTKFKPDSGTLTRRGDPAALEDLVSAAETWEETKAAFEPIAEKYESLGKEYFFRATGAFVLIRNIRGSIPQVEQNMQDLKERGPSIVSAEFENAIALAQDAVETNRFGVFQGLNSPMRLALVRPNAVARVYQALPIVSEREAAGMAETVASGIARIASLKAQAATQIIEQNTLPPTGYASADLSAIIQMATDGFKAIHGNVPILEVRVPEGQWTRQQGWRYSRTDRAFQYYDYSTIDTYVVEKTSKRVATFWKVTVHKKHLEGDALISNPASRTRHTPEPDQQILIANL